MGGGCALIRSMTGFGRCEKTVNGYDIYVEIKAVNHRYADYNIKLPRVYNFLEDDIKKYLQQYIKRGKVDVYLTIYKELDDAKEVVLNEALAGSYIKALKLIAEKFDVRDDISVSSVARYNDIFEIKHDQEDEEIIKTSVVEVLGEALSGFMSAREREGSKLAKDMLERNNLIKGEVAKIEKIAPDTVVEHKNNIEARIRELIGDASVDENRLLTETAIYADKLSINEEIVRLKCHQEEFDRIMSKGDAVGRRLDFLLQEMNRETNTIGSKANNLEISNIVINVKAELEKIREQLQNLE